MGLGDQVGNDLFLNDGVYSLWARDKGDPVQDGKMPGKNMYGVDPFVMGQSPDYHWYGIFMNNAAA